MKFSGIPNCKASGASCLPPAMPTRSMKNSALKILRGRKGGWRSLMNEPETVWPLSIFHQSSYPYLYTHERIQELPELRNAHEKIAKWRRNQCRWHHQ